MWHEVNSVFFLICLVMDTIFDKFGFFQDSTVQGNMDKNQEILAENINVKIRKRLLLVV